MNTQLDIQNMSAIYQIQREVKDPSVVKRRLDHIAHELLGHVWDDSLLPTDTSQGQDEAIYFIDQVDVNLSLNLSDDDRTLAKNWAQALHQGILQTISQRGSGSIVFQNRSEFIASFLADLLRGQAWEQWYYQEFEPLRSQSLGQIARQVLTADSDLGRDSLLELTRRGDLALLLGNLSDAEVETIVLHCLLPSSPRVVLPNTYPVWLRSLRSRMAESGFTATDSLYRNLARLYLTLISQQPELGPDVNLARFIRDVLELRQTIASLSDRTQILTLIASEELITILRQLGRQQQLIVSEELVTTLRQLKRQQQWLATLIHEVSGPKVTGLLQELGVETRQSAQVSSHQFFTPYGGIFLLVPAIVEMELYRYLQDSAYPEPAEISKVGLLLFVIGLQCLGRQNAEQGFSDRALSFFASLSSSANKAMLETYIANLTLEMHHIFNQDFQNHLTELVADPYFSMLRRGDTSIPPEHLESLYLWSEGEQFISDREWDQSLAEVSGQILHWFSAKLGAFAGSSPEYLRRNFLESQAEIEVSVDRIIVNFITCPLQMVLRMAGFDNNVWDVPWLEDKQLEFRFN